VLRIEAVPYDGDAAARLVPDLYVDIAERYAGDGEDDDHDPATEVSADDFTPPLGVFLVAFLGEEPVGCAGIHRFDEGVAELKRMYVVPAARGRGVARALLRGLEAAAAELGFRRVRLETGLRQPEAMALYGSAGYGVIEPYGYYRESPLSVCYEKTL
jgi:GNAT superfamily N-acetyltransferase